MSIGAGEFEGFVTARWYELHAVAVVTTGHPTAAAHITATALAALADQWSEITSTGTPTATARRAVLTAALSSSSSSSPSPAYLAVTPAPLLGVGPDDGLDPDALTRSVLTTVLTAAPATARAALAARRWWDEPPGLVAACSDSDTATVQAGLAQLERDLAEAHAIAVGHRADELTGALAAALADTLEHLAETTPVHDPVARVDAARADRAARAARRRRPRRLALTAAGLIVAAAATALAWPDVPPPGVPTPPAEAQQWAALSTWTPRGSMAGDPAVTMIAADHDADPGARLLFAGPVGDTIAVVMSFTEDTATYPAGGPDAGQLRLRLWAAPASRGPGALVASPIEGDDTARTQDVVALSIDQHAVGAPPVVLVMTRPDITSASLIVGSVPQPDGSILPVVRELPLTDGIASYPVQSDAYTPHLAVENYQGPAAGIGPDRSQLPAHGPAAELAAAQRTLLAAVTGHPADTFRTPTALESVVDFTDIDPGRIGADPGPVQLTVVTTVTADGGWVRTTRLSSTTQNFALAYLEHLTAVPADDHTHALLPSPAAGRPRFIALGPDAATAILVTIDGQVRDTATIHNGLAVLTSAEDPPGTIFRLRLLAPDGHTVYDEIPPTPNELLG